MANASVARVRPLRVDLERIDRLARGHQQEVVFWTTEREIGADLRQTDAPDGFSLGVDDDDTGVAKWTIGTGPDVAVDVDGHVVRPAVDPIHHHVGEESLV